MIVLRKTETFSTIFFGNFSSKILRNCELYYLKEKNKWLHFGFIRRMSSRNFRTEKSLFLW